MPKSASGSRVLHEEAGLRYSIAAEEQRDEIVRDDFAWASRALDNRSG